MADGKENYPDDKDPVLKQLYECRALEINTQWQRSIFLATFIVLLFTGYGFFFDRVFFDGKDYSIAIHIVGVLLGILIVFFGIFWIAIAKGSKRWTDIYERKIFLREETLGIESQYKCKIETFLSNYNCCYQRCCYHKATHQQGESLSDDNVHCRLCLSCIP